MWYSTLGGETMIPSLKAIPLKKYVMVWVKWVLSCHTALDSMRTIGLVMYSANFQFYCLMCPCSAIYIHYVWCSKHWQCWTRNWNIDSKWQCFLISFTWLMTETWVPLPSSTAISSGLIESDSVMFSCNDQFQTRSISTGNLCTKHGTVYLKLCMGPVFVPPCMWKRWIWWCKHRQPWSKKPEHRY